MPANQMWERLALQLQAAYNAKNLVPYPSAAFTPLEYVPDIFMIHKFGENIDAIAGDDIWGGAGVYTGQPISDVETVEVFSDDVQDNPSGTGASAVRIQGLCSVGNYIVEDIELDGTNSVYSTRTFSRVFRTAITGPVGSNGKNEGSITVRHSTTTSNVFSEQTNGQSTIGAFTIPRGFVGFIQRIFASISRGTAGTSDRDCTLSLNTRNLDEGWRTQRHFAVTSGASTFEDFNGGIYIPERCDIKLSVLAVYPASGSDITAGFDVLCVKKDLLP